jgi:hypothetical protein
MDVPGPSSVSQVRCREPCFEQQVLRVFDLVVI